MLFVCLLAGRLLWFSLLAIGLHFCDQNYEQLLFICTYVFMSRHFGLMGCTSVFRTAQDGAGFSGSGLLLPLGVFRPFRQFYARVVVDVSYFGGCPGVSGRFAYG